MSANRCSILHDSSARTVYVVTVLRENFNPRFSTHPLPFIKTSFGENRARREIANNVASKFAASLGSMAKRETVYLSPSGTTRVVRRSRILVKEIVTNVSRCDEN